MNLSMLLQGITDEQVAQIAVTDITNDSRKVKPGSVYVAIVGIVSDGHDYVPQALAAGAVSVIVERDMGLAEQVIVADTHRAYARLCANFFGNPARDLHLLGVTGTNGKTSVATVVKHLLTQVGLSVGLIGTIQMEYGTVVEKTANTTPDPYVLHQSFAKMKAAGCTHVIMEVSSHALSQQRLYGCHFDVAAFTNLSQDHLDYHKDMGEYFEAKAQLFEMAPQWIVNLRDAYGKKLFARYPQAMTYTTESETADWSARDMVFHSDAVTFSLVTAQGTYPVHFAIPGQYSVENALTALAICAKLGYPIGQLVEEIKTLKGITGRCEVLLKTDRFTVMRDYAHTPDGIENILSSVKSYATGRVVAVFGCGGDRDRSKRPKMAKAAASHADCLIVTSDNPRSEEPEAIIAEIVVGIPDGVHYTVVVDRREAMAYAMQSAVAGDTILLLGKGHEDYQILKDRTIDFDEKKVVGELAIALGLS